MDGISVVVPSMGKSKTIVSFLKSIESQNCDFAVELIFVFNNIDRSAFLQLKNKLSSFSAALDISFYLIETMGVNQARNFGLSQAKYSLLFFTDDDCVFDDQWILQKHAYAHKDQELFAVGGRYSLPMKAGFFDMVYNEIQMRWLSEGFFSNKLDSGCGYLIGGHFSVKKEMLEWHKLQFESKITYGGSELSFFNQANNLNLKMNLLDIYVLHLSEESFVSLHKKIFKQGKGKSYLEQTNQNNFIKNKVSYDLSLIYPHYFVKIARHYFSFIFWIGYFAQKRKKLEIIRFLLKNLKASFHAIKYGLLFKMNQVIEKKKSYLDRF